MFQRQLLKDSDVEPLAGAVTTILERVGLLCQNDEILKALHAAGAQVDFASQRARFPKRMTAEFVEAIRKEQAAIDRDGPAFQKPDLPAVSLQVAQLFYDAQTRQRRGGNRKDFIDLVKLGQVLHPDEGVGHALALTDQHPMIEPLEAGLLLAEYASNPQPPFASDVSQIDYLDEMGQILGRKDWYAWGAICFAHPLRFERTSADKFLRRARRGGVAGIANMSVVPITAPVSLEGLVAIAAAEFLAIWMTGRCLCPTIRLTGGMWCGTADMRSGEVSFCCFDAMRRSFAVSEFLRRWCGVEVAVGGGEYCDAKVPGPYAVLEKAYKAMTIAAFTGRHPPVGEGLLETGKTISPVQLLLERDFTAGLGRYADPFQPSPGNVALEEILEIGLAMECNHMETDHTLKRFKDCLWLPQFDRFGYAGPQHEQAAVERAQEHLGDLLASYQKPPFDSDKLAAMRAVVQRAQRKLA